VTTSASLQRKADTDETITQREFFSTETTLVGNRTLQLLTAMAWTKRFRLEAPLGLPRQRMLKGTAYFSALIAIQCGWHTKRGTGWEKLHLDQCRHDQDMFQF